MLKGASLRFGIAYRNVIEWNALGGALKCNPEDIGKNDPWNVHHSMSSNIVSTKEETINAYFGFSIITDESGFYERGALL